MNKELEIEKITEREKKNKERIQSLLDCRTPEELFYNIWTKESERWIDYRTPFVNWIESYKLKTTPQWKSYKTPRELAEGIWKPFLDRSDDYNLFSDLRDALIKWIEDYTFFSTENNDLLTWIEKDQLAGECLNNFLKNEPDTSPLYEISSKLLRQLIIKGIETGLNYSRNERK
jgi:hypothetical protein